MNEQKNINIVLAIEYPLNWENSDALPLVLRWACALKPKFKLFLGTTTSICDSLEKEEHKSTIFEFIHSLMWEEFKGHRIPIARILLHANGVHVSKL